MAKGQRLQGSIAPQKSAAEIGGVAASHLLLPRIFSDQAGKPPDKRGFSPPATFDVYRAVSRQIHGIFADYTARIEPLALDEAYLDVTENRRGLPTASVTAKEIRARIFQETGLTASAGVSYSGIPRPFGNRLTESPGSIPVVW